MANLEIRQLPILADNYIYLIREPSSGAVGVVDPAGVTPVLRESERLGWKITHIFNTHHHQDHVGGNYELKWLTGCKVVGPAADDRRIPGIDIRVKDGDTFRFGDTGAQVIFVPGHTTGHIAYWFRDSNALFCGDTLFSIGCGRLFEGTAEQMWQSLLRLRALPPETRVFCAHEYTQSNIQFALTVDPRNEALARRAAEVKAARARGLPTVPSLMVDEVAANPFLRADHPELAAAVGMTGQDAVEVFAEIRRRKDVFKAA